MNKKLGIVAYGFPAIGKTTVCKNYDNFLDLESSNYKWIFTENQLKMSVEERKGVDKQLNPEWPNNYYQAIENARLKYDYIFVAYTGIEYCQQHNIKYMRFFPTLDQKEDYITRMKIRGNSPQFVEKIAENYENFITQCKSDNDSVRIELLPGEYLEDCLKRVGIIQH